LFAAWTLWIFEEKLETFTVNAYISKNTVKIVGLETSRWTDNMGGKIIFTSYRYPRICRLGLFPGYQISVCINHGITEHLEDERNDPTKS
jgi:hypothetical protein